MANKYHGKFIMDEIVFYSDEIANSFIKQIEDVYEGHIADGFDLKNIINGERRRALKQFKINIEKNENNAYCIKGSGLRTWIWNFERFIRSAYDAHKIVCYKPEHWVNDMVDSMESLDEYKEWEKKFPKENAERYKSFKLGKFVPPETVSVDREDWRDGIKTKPDLSEQTPAQKSLAKDEKDESVR